MAWIDALGARIASRKKQPVSTIDPFLRASIQSQAIYRLSPDKERFVVTPGAPEICLCQIHINS